MTSAESGSDPFVVLYEQHASSVYRFCLSRLGDEQAAEDATSEVFLKALSAFDRFRGGNAAAWLIVIARRTVADAFRRQRPLTEPIAFDPVDDSLTPEEAAVRAERIDELRSALQLLTDDQRSVLELQLAGWNSSEVAEALGKSRNAVKMLRLRAMQRLRGQLQASRSEVVRGS